jgi:hypothetical protein
MISFSITIDATSVLSKLTRLEQFDGVEGALNDEADLIVDDERQYPPELPNQRYVRTFNLRDQTRARAARRSGSGYEVEVESGADYASEVVGAKQRSAFVGRWRLFKVVAQAHVPALRARVQAAVIKSWGR